MLPLGMTAVWLRGSALAALPDERSLKQALHADGVWVRIPAIPATCSGAMRPLISVDCGALAERSLAGALFGLAWVGAVIVALRRASEPTF